MTKRKRIGLNTKKLKEQHKKRNEDQKKNQTKKERKDLIEKIKKERKIINAKFDLKNKIKIGKNKKKNSQQAIEIIDDEFARLTIEKKNHISKMFFKLINYMMENENYKSSYLGGRN
jgi:hypothetical protein